MSEHGDKKKAKKERDMDELKKEVSMVSTRRKVAFCSSQKWCLLSLECHTPLLPAIPQSEIWLFLKVKRL